MYNDVMRMNKEGYTTSTMEGINTGLADRCNSGLFGHIFRFRPAGGGINKSVHLSTGYGGTMFIGAHPMAWASGKHSRVTTPDRHWLQSAEPLLASHFNCYLSLLSMDNWGNFQLSY